MFVSDPRAAEMVRQQPETAAAFKQFARVTKAVVGVGGWRPPASALYDALTRRERTLLIQAGASAYGNEKVTAVRPAIAGGFIQTLVANASFARSLIAHSDDSTV